MYLVPYEQWCNRWPDWGHYLQWLVESHREKHQWSPETVRLAVEEGRYKGSNEGASAIDCALPLHILTFQPSAMRLYSWKSVPAGMDTSESDIEHWATNRGGQCQSHFFMGYHPWAGKNEAWEIAGNRWWPTYAWLRGWTWHFGCVE